MYVPVGHSGVRAGTVSKLSGRPAFCAMLHEGERKKTLEEHICELY